jgi:hypothetical protein
MPISGQRKLYDNYARTLYSYKDDDAIANVSFNDFLTTQRVYVFDLSTIKYTTTNINDPVDISVVCTTTNNNAAGTCNFVYLLELEQVAIMDLSASNATLIQASPSVSI